MYIYIYIRICIHIHIYIYIYIDAARGEVLERVGRRVGRDGVVWRAYTITIHLQYVFTIHVYNYIYNHIYYNTFVSYIYIYIINKNVLFVCSCLLVFMRCAYLLSAASGEPTRTSVRCAPRAVRRAPYANAHMRCKGFELMFIYGLKWSNMCQLMCYPYC